MIQKVKWGEKQWIEGVNVRAVHEPVNVLIRRTFRSKRFAFLSMWDKIGSLKPELSQL